MADETTQPEAQSIHPEEKVEPQPDAADAEKPVEVLAPVPEGGKKTPRNPREKYCRNCKLPKIHCECGRPSKFTAAIVAKLYEAYSVGANHEQAAFQADIHLVTLYRWLKEYPRFASRVEQLRQRPVMRALNRSFNALLIDDAHARWFLERKLPEYATVQRHKLGGDDAPDAKPITIQKIIIEAPGVPEPPTNGSGDQI